MKDPIPTESRWGIYFIPCTCNVDYNGQTGRALSKRLSEKIDFSKEVLRQRNNYLSNDDALDPSTKMRVCKFIEICQLFYAFVLWKISFCKRAYNWHSKKHIRTLLLRMHYAFILNAFLVFKQIIISIFLGLLCWFY